ncbi:choice-of-anchor D domain-containing protein [Desulfococcaceae bacterium HSG7]|nr:choice-of-anchor D domain-containing protein [Desulfococcaceae bacterium HSG7]
MPFSRTDTVWTSMSPAADIFFPQLDQTDNFTFDGKADNPKQVRTAFQDYDNYGNVRTEIRYGDLSVNSDDFTTHREFLYDTDRWIMDRVEHTYITDAGGSKLRENWSDFDADGNLIREEAWLDTGDNPVTQHDYDSHGNRILTTDPENNDTRTEYDTELNTFPIKTYNAKNQVFTRTFNLLYGQAETETDPNGHTTAWEFDTLGRKIKEIRPFDTSDRPTKAIEYHIDGTAPEYVKTSLREQSGADGTVDTYQIIDGFAALIQTRTEAEDSVYQVVTDVYYDKMDRVERQSNPYLASKTDGYGAPDENAPATAYEYDTPGRPVTVFNPDGTSIQRAFDHWTVTETDENGHATSYWFDAYQSLLQVQENNGNESYLTGYEYNPAGELIQITDHYGNLTEIDYDTLGRKTAMDDPDMGAWAYGYDRNGNLISQQDARGIVTVIEYDELNRKTLIDYPSDPDVRFFYDLTTVGVLSKTEDNAGTVTYQYDERLRKTAETRAMDGHTWTTAWQYDAMDRIFSMTYPDGEETVFQYNSQGALESVPGIMPGINYNATGQITQKTYANGLETAYTYHPQNSRLTSMNTPGIQDFKYTYDNAGNVKSIQDGMTGQTETFGYDDLDRLTSAGDSEYQASYAYNAIGNMLAENMMGVTFEYTYGENAGPHAATGKTMSRPVIALLHIENNAVYTVVPDVTLNIRPFGEPTHYMASEDPSFQGAAWLPYTKTPPFTLSDGFGDKTVYVKVKNDAGESDARNDTIEYLLDTDGDSVADKYDEDDDDDGMTDEWETTYNFDPLNPDDAALDNDGDGLTNLEEFDYNGNPTLTDTDNDGWNDYDEVFVYQTDPSNTDTDGDGMIDSEDINPNGQGQAPAGKQYAMLTGAFNSGGDLRNDNLNSNHDRIGMIAGNITAAQAIVTTTAQIGPDGGTIIFPGGLLVLTFPPGATSEIITVSIVRLNTIPPANEGFQMLGRNYQIEAADLQGDAVTTFDQPVEMVMKYDPDALDELDEDDLRINYFDENAGNWVGLASVVDPGNRTVTASTTHFTIFGMAADAPLADSDHDGLPDWWEDNYFEDLTHDGTQDSDGDGLTDAEEFAHDINPLMADTDGDGYNDYEEVQAGSNPLYSGSVPEPEIDLKQDVTDIPDGGSYDFSNQTVGTGTDTDFTIENSGITDLTLTTPLVIQGDNAGEFSIQSQPASPVVAENATSFTVRFNPASVGVKTATISIVNNDKDENPFDLTVTGTGAPSLKAEITSPAPSSALDSTSVTFIWNDPGADQYQLLVGTSQGTDDLYSGTQGTDTSALVSGLPDDGSTVYVRLQSLAGGDWLYNDYTYTAYNNNCTGDFKITAGDGAAHDQFGYSVSISGDYAIAGVPYDNDNGINSGSAYIFFRSGTEWIQQAKLTASDAAFNDNFGWSVAINGDTAIVGAHFDDDGGARSGSAYIFVKPEGGWVGALNETAKLTASDAAANDWFGISVAVNGNTAIVGAHFDDDGGARSGSAYIFVKPEGGWSGALHETAKLTASDAAADDWFGLSVSVSGDTAIAGAHFDDDGGSMSGSAYMFVKPETGWSGTLNETAKLTASDADIADMFGYSVSVSGDTAIIGAFLDDNGSGNSGSAYMFVKPEGGWSRALNETAKLTASDAHIADMFGYSVSVSGDTAIVGAFSDDNGAGNSGSAYVFVKPKNGWSGALNETAKLTADDAHIGDMFGYSVSVSGDTAIVGAFWDDDRGDNSGSAYLFCLNDAGSAILKGDLNGDNVVNLADAIIALQVITGYTPTQLRTDYAISGTDVNGDDKVGMEELIYILQKEAELR